MREDQGKKRGRKKMKNALCKGGTVIYGNCRQCRGIIEDRQNENRRYKEEMKYRNLLRIDPDEAEEYRLWLIERGE